LPRIPGFGSKRVRLLHDELKLRGVEDLRKAAREARIHEVPGFGEKTESHILRAVQTEAVGSYLLSVIPSDFIRSE
jgi:DNA polymerase (family X)